MKKYFFLLFLLLVYFFLKINVKTKPVFINDETTNDVCKIKIVYENGKNSNDVKKIFDNYNNEYYIKKIIMDNNEYDVGCDTFDKCINQIVNTDSSFENKYIVNGFKIKEIYFLAYKKNIISYLNKNDIIYTNY